MLPFTCDKAVVLTGALSRLARPDVDFPPGAKRIATIRKALLNWWRPARRDLPWRPGAAPYAVWVSEIMLQQTRVETVKPYYRRFLNRFPGVGSLAAAPIGEVLKVWEGLGYYHRARNLHRSARLIVRRGGRLPTTAREWKKLPGVGRYTAAAIASIAFGRDEAALDGNVARVLCRMFLVRRFPSRPGVKKLLESLAGRLIPPGRAGEWNQAMMDLGATVCTPAAPQCDVCPLRRPCQARAAGWQDRLPVKPARRKLPHYDIAAAIVWRRGRILIDRRPEKGLLGGLWEFPGGKVTPGETPASAARREVREELGIRVGPCRKLATIRHAYSHFRITLHAFQCRYLSGRTQAIGCDDFRWVRPEDLDDYAFPAANRRIIERLRGGKFAPVQ